MQRVFYCVGCQRFQDYSDATEVRLMGYEYAPQAPQTHPFIQPPMGWRPNAAPLNLCASCLPVVS